MMLHALCSIGVEVEEIEGNANVASRANEGEGEKVS